MRGKAAVPEEIQSIISTLKLKAHPEGGWYRRVYQSQSIIPPEMLENSPGPRHLTTSIYFLLTENNFSAFHRLQFDERWYHHSGHALDIEIIHPEGSRETLCLGPAEGGFQPQAFVPARTWFAARMHKNAPWALTGCSMSPGFHFDDFELAARELLIQQYPQHRDIITELTRQ